MSEGEPHSAEFRRRREEMKARIDPLDRDTLGGRPDRKASFDAVYDMAQGDPAGVPWADLRPKSHLIEWLGRNPGRQRSAIDVACGLGDNAEALAAAGYGATAFDRAERAVEWARERFPKSTVAYRVADLFDPPADWLGGFDLVHECYTLQSVPPPMLERMLPAIADLVAPGGTLLVYARIRKDGSGVDGPPWPLQESDAMRFADRGFVLVSREVFEIRRPDRAIAHWFCHWQLQSDRTTRGG